MAAGAAVRRSNSWWKVQPLGYVNRIPDEEMGGAVVARCPVCGDPFTLLDAECAGTYLLGLVDDLDHRHERTPVQPIKVNSLGLTEYGLRHRLLHEL